MGEQEGGGSGRGKSTILNILYEKKKKEKLSKQKCYQKAVTFFTS